MYTVLCVCMQALMIMQFSYPSLHPAKHKNLHLILNMPQDIC